ncbi:MAG: hypothetical protein HW418_4126, partial [Anaerolineales bacterium]|nr:hypothetical protein [Anaerolineales bacterium]
MSQRFELRQGQAGRGLPHVESVTREIKGEESHFPHRGLDQHVRRAELQIRFNHS